ncbi:MAG: hypothetical protein ACI865_002791 [Flavobacteriaceae bacterium]|jgi:uncharacterized protein (DUF1800 family)
MPEENENGSISYSLAPYTGAWTKVEAGHLLRRTLFGPTNQQMLDTVANGMAASVASLLTIPAIGMPLAYDPGDTVTAFGNSWVTDVFPTNPIDVGTTATARNISLAVWVMKRINEEQFSISEKMCLFWQNHFATPFCSDARATYDYFVLLRSHALGNFKQFAKDVTINPCMLLFLNGATNTLFSPNENYARELLELFTIGKGDQIALGDYSTYKEEDVAAGAKILTGYLIDGLVSDTLTNVTANFSSLYHDATTKTLSSHFGGASIPDAGPVEYSNYIDIIFQQNALAEYMCRNIYRYFVNYDLTVDVETNVIPDMAATFIANNYEILPVMTELLSSEHFYDISVRGALIKSPLDMMFSAFNATESVPGFDLLTDSEMYAFVYSVCDVMGQSYAEPPSVAGWPAYYQEPSFSQLWLNSAYIKLRFQITDFLTVFTGIPGNGNNWKLSVLAFVDNLSLPTDAIAVIDDIADVFAPKGLDATQKLILKAILTNGLPDFEWTIQYNAYVANPTDPTVSDPVELRINSVLQRMFQMPEFQTI